MFLTNIFLKTMRTWLSKTMGYVTEKTNDVWTGIFTTKGEKIYEGDFVTLTIIRKIYVGPLGGWDFKEYNKKSNWKETKEINSGNVVSTSDCRFYIFCGKCKYIEIFHGMTDRERNYLEYIIEKL